MNKRMVWFYIAAMIGGAIIGVIFGKVVRAEDAPKAQDRPAFDTMSAEPDEATKRCALLKAYHMNGDSMVRWGSIDLSKDKDPCPKTIRVIPLTPKEQPKGKLG